jgi:mannitol/fructose-specific phosphotransferase system IIA component (Ntr-type)
VVLLLTPESAANQHLATLAALSRPFRDAAFAQQIRKAPDAAAMHRLLAGA